MAKTMVSLYSLVDLFHFMEAGRIAVPAFQRGYVWSKKNASMLFDSVNRGLPIGMLIAVESDDNGFAEATPNVSMFPTRKPTDVRGARRLWLIDGCQRLAALYNGLFESAFPLGLLYDLRTQEFIFQDQADGRDELLQMSSLFNSDRLMELQSQLVQQLDADNLLEELNGLRERFYTYQVPTMIVMEAAPEDLVEVFMRLNSAGTTLTKNEIKRISQKDRHGKRGE
ncbi:DUF262 domain-containing protein [Acaryochloris sp. 'Moss Beach']|uniref:DUF262 domain-containing protein n=1 Tax=Acaryochloris sp. 'Moss Beach' TaxID=2740837 RepID=UPI001F36FC54|nr:DUF262 domain-containing protein [Acaryochloris sp. 'Moss Beach']UJB70211.1 DUF262 domain-containing protein [Acaryochloris sp. 'Moss Beach']